MPDPTRSLRQALRSHKVSLKPTRTRYPNQLRQDVAAHAFEQLSQDVSLGAIARSLDLNQATLQRWVGRRQRLRPIEVDNVPRSPLLSVLAPNGVRVEGLDLEGVIRLLRELP